MSQGAITIHADEQLGTTDGGVARYRRMLRNAIRAVAAGDELPVPTLNADGHIPSMAGDVIVKVPHSNHDDDALQAWLGQEVGKIVAGSAPLSAGERAGRIEHDVRALLAAGAPDSGKPG